jgi:outer membrane lipoprotein SlyB
MLIRSFGMALLLSIVSLVSVAPASAQTTAPVIRSFTVQQVPQLAPGTELIFKVSGSPGASVVLAIDGVASQLGLVETSSGNYQGAYTVSIRDRIVYDGKARATLKLGAQQTTAVLGQTLLTEAAHAQQVAAHSPIPQISGFETRNTGALTGGHELSFVIVGTGGGAAQVSLDDGKTQIPLVEEKNGRYSGHYTVKTRDQFSDTTQVLATLSIADKTTRVTKNLAAGSVVPTALAPIAPAAAPVVAVCEECGVVQAVNVVKVKGKPNFLGAIAGGVAGAALGNQVGKGDGKTAATVLGAVGGAVAGREIEKRVRSDTHYDVVVKLDNGSSKTISFETDPGFKVGSKVRLSGESLVAQ